MIERELIEQYIPDLYAGCIVDFYMELNLNCFRGGFYKVMPDGDGELQECFIFPLIKNGFEYYSRNRGRMVFSATRTKNNKNCSHVMFPVIDERTIRVMAARGIFERYLYASPVLGNIYAKLSDMKHPPKFSEGSLQRIIIDNAEMKRIESIMAKRSKNKIDDKPDESNVPKKKGMVMIHKDIDIVGNFREGLREKLLNKDNK